MLFGDHTNVVKPLSVHKIWTMRTDEHLSIAGTQPFEQGRKITGLGRMLKQLGFFNTEKKLWTADVMLRQFFQQSNDYAPLKSMAKAT